MKIYFTRHCESQANVLNVASTRGLRHGLTLKGRQQALALAERLQGLSITHIYSSPVLRAIETTVLLANELAVDYEVVEALREYDCGIIEGRSDDEAWRLWRELFDAWLRDKEWERRIEGGESFYDVQNRFIPFIDELVQQYQDTDTNLLCVGHGGIYWMMIPMVLKNIDVSYVVERQGFHYGTLITAEVGPEGLVCRKWDDDEFGV
ncbi:MAG: histidine phosphatase family protein [Candidatus Promineifilaceae bacterium]